jgi:adenosylmethionine-8-amino-7-oxononanoate aminotransferase
VGDTHGHCHPRIVEAIREQAGQIDQLIFAGWTHDPAEDVARGLTEILPPELTRVFFSDSGSTSVEVALKMALGFWAHSGEPRHRILVMEHSYHGDTIGAMSVGSAGSITRPTIRCCSTWAAFRSRWATGRTRSKRWKRPAAKGRRLHRRTAGARRGGMMMYGAGVLAAMAEVCRRHGVLFIADEVMTGWGRTGTLLACEQAGVVPDILCLAKGLTGGSMPLAVTLAREPIFQAHWSTDRAKTFYHSSSYTANPIACAAARANLAIWREEPVRERIATLGARQQAGLDRLAALPGIRNPRRCGTIIALEVEDPPAAIFPHWRRA